MNKYVITILICFTCLLTACGYTDNIRQSLDSVSGQAVSGGGVHLWGNQKNQIKDKGNSTASGAAAADTAVSGTGIASADNVTEEMQHADYWIDRTVASEKILMSEADIQKFNAKILKLLASYEEADFYDLAAYGETIAGEKLRSMIEKPDFTMEKYFAVTEPVTETQWKKYDENRNIDNIADFNKIRYGIICTRADVRELPTAENITDEQGDSAHDVLQDTALAVNEPVLVLHTSKDGEWFFVMANESAGWIHKSTVGLCENKMSWQNAQEMKQFLVITGDRISLSPDPYSQITSEITLTMGTKLAIAEKEESQSMTKDRTIYDNYLVKIPVRTDDGALDYRIATIPVGKDVHVGYLEYTRANVLRQAFKMLGNFYGWGGMYGERDCSSMTRDIYLCFGFRLPRSSSAQAMIPGESRVDLSGLSEKEKVQKLNSAEPGMILQMSGHVMIYLGCTDRKYYVISANGGFIPSHIKEDADSSTVNTRTRLVTVNDLNVKSPSNGKTWISQLTTIVGIP